MIFATPRSWERVSDILKIDSDVTKSVIKNKIIGNIGSSEIECIKFAIFNDKGQCLNIRQGN